MPTIYVPPSLPDGPPPTPPPPYSPPTGPGPIPPKRKQHWAPDPQRYATDHLASDLDDALWSFGEYVMFVLLWNVRDFQAGLVGRCPTCYLTFGKIADAYGQASREKCPDCFGTTFEGGYRAKIVRPAIFTDTDVEDRPEVARGATAVATTTMQTTHGFTLHHQDILVRGDGSRWRLYRPDSTITYIGFELKGPKVGWNVGTVTREDDASVAYIIPPSTDEAIDLLAVEGFRRPLDFSSAETIRGPL